LFQKIIDALVVKREVTGQNLRKLLTSSGGGLSRLGEYLERLCFRYSHDPSVQYLLLATSPIPFTRFLL